MLLITALGGAVSHFKRWKKTQMIPRKVRWRAAGFLPCLMRICFHHPLIVGLLQSSPVRSFTPNNLAGWRRHVSGLRRLLIAQSYHCFRGDLVCVFGPKLLNRLISKMRTRERKEGKKSPANLTFRSLETSQLHQKWAKKKENDGKRHILMNRAHTSKACANIGSIPEPEIPRRHIYTYRRVTN